MPTGFYRLKVDKITRETQDAVSIRFLVPPPLKGIFTYKAGQYLTLYANINGEDVRRSYSVCESPYIDDMPTVAVKEVEDGRMSIFLNRELKEGDLIEAMPPMGKFTVEPDSSRSAHYVLFGGGSGVTPLKSILLTVLTREPNSKVTLIYANRNESSIIFRSQLENLATQYAGRFELVQLLDEAPAGWSGLTGMLNPMKIRQLIQQHVSEPAAAQYYICGPGGLMTLVRETLEHSNIESSHIHLEYFTAVEKSAEVSDSSDETEVGEIKTRTVEVELFGDVQNVSVKPNQTILEAAQEAGMDPPFSCTVGVCTTCRAKVHSGKVKMDEREGLSDAEVEEGYVLTCQSHPLTDDVSLVYE
ncbi:MAG: 2Fe-2S iron-sulfur cluster binding domain-containing protein [Bacteroidetes bacterium]|nr:2Fe-2S iron-sulfur cluster binding domain-containing protein [Bacteroidota bacterium]